MAFIGIILLLVCWIVYFIPAIIAGYRHKKQAAAILVLNFLLGWTILGWVGSLVWACMND
jgi:hypothetical protein